MKWLLLSVAALLLLTLSPTYVQGDNGIPVTNLPDDSAPAVTSGLNSAQDTGTRSGATHDNAGSAQDSPARELTLQQYITPDDRAVKSLADGINGAKDTYDVASRWLYISDVELNNISDKWVTPHEFLVDFPYYPTNPLQGRPAGDCEEKANTLVSLFRAQGIKPEEVRVVLGEVSFNDVKTGHAWVEILYNGQWLPLDPNWGPYWNQKSGKLVERKAVPFDYYATHDYPVIQVWACYNDVYYLDARNNTGNFPDSWGSEPAA